MAAPNIMAQVEARLDALDAKFTALLWVIGSTSVIISLLLTLLTVFGGGSG